MWCFINFKKLIVLLTNILWLFRCFPQQNSATENVKEEKILFQANTQLAMSSSDYQVAAGDVYALSFYSNGTSVSYTITVDPTYKIRIANLGSINVAGLTFIQLKSNIETLVTRNYPLSVVTFVMIQPSVFKVLVKGEVSSAQEIQVWALTRLSEILPKSELTEFSSSRIIKITDKNGKTKTCDLFKAKRDGDFSQDPYLRPGDKIEFTRVQRKVTISGSVERAGTYELLEGQNLAELINLYAGGNTKTANLSKIQLVRIDDSDEKIQKIVYLGEKDVEKNYKLEDKDILHIYDWSENQPFIEIKGIIKNPAANLAENRTRESSFEPAPSDMFKTRIYFYKDERYSSLIRRIRKMLTVYSDIENTYVQRGKSQLKIDAQKILDDDSFEIPFFVQKGDELVIPYKPFFDFESPEEILNTASE